MKINILGLLTTQLYTLVTFIYNKTEISGHILCIIYQKYIQIYKLRKLI